MAKNKKDERPKLWLIIVLILISIIFWVASFTNFSLNGATIVLIVISLASTGFTVLKTKQYVDYIKSDMDKKKAKKELEKHAQANKELIKQGIYPQYKEKGFNLNDIIVVDTETTGINKERDEILQLSIIDGYGNVLFNHLLKPVTKKTWSEAEQVNGISPDMVKDERNITEYADEINRIFVNKVIVGYNVEFDLGFLNNANVFDDRVTEPIICVDVMRPFSVINGEYNSRSLDYRWKKLTDCAEYYGYKWEGKAHDSLADCKATLYCFKKMCGM